MFNIKLNGEEKKNIDYLEYNYIYKRIMNTNDKVDIIKDVTVLADLLNDMEVDSNAITLRDVIIDGINNLDSDFNYDYNIIQATCNILKTIELLMSSNDVNVGKRMLSTINTYVLARGFSSDYEYYERGSDSIRSEVTRDLNSEVFDLSVRDALTMVYQTLGFGYALYFLYTLVNYFDFRSFANKPGMGKCKKKKKEALTARY